VQTAPYKADATKCNRCGGKRTWEYTITSGTGKAMPAHITDDGELLGSGDCPMYLATITGNKSKGNRTVEEETEPEIEEEPIEEPTPEEEPGTEKIEIPGIIQAPVDLQYVEAFLNVISASFVRFNTQADQMVPSLQSIDSSLIHIRDSGNIEFTDALTAVATSQEKFAEAVDRLASCIESLSLDLGHAIQALAPAKRAGKKGKEAVPI
jgi:hypothetical protein